MCAHQVVIALVKSRSDLLLEILSSVVPTISAQIADEKSEIVKESFLKTRNTVSRCSSRTSTCEWVCVQGN